VLCAPFAQAPGPARLRASGPVAVFFLFGAAMQHWNNIHLHCGGIFHLVGVRHDLRRLSAMRIKPVNRPLPRPEVNRVLHCPATAIVYYFRRVVVLGVASRNHFRSRPKRQFSAEAQPVTAGAFIPWSRVGGSTGKQHHAVDQAFPRGSSRHVEQR